MPYFLLCFFIGLLSLTTCKATEEISTTKYGALEEYFSSRSTLINLPPQASVFLIGPASLSDSAQRGLTSWIEAIGRNNDINIKYFPDLNKAKRDPLMAKKNFKIFLKDESQLATSDCRKNTKICAFAGIQDNGNLEVIFCETYSPTVVLSIMTHELGHLFGLCDQYSQDSKGNKISDLGMHPDCLTSIYRSIDVDNLNRTVMMGGLDAPAEITQDDTVGVRIQACRKDSRINKVWADKVGSFMTSWLLDPFFKSEILRIMEQGGEFLPECIPQN